MWLGRYLLLFLLLASNAASAQLVWADSVLSTFTNDVSKSYAGIRIYSDTLINLYEQSGAH